MSCFRKCNNGSEDEEDGKVRGVRTRIFSSFRSSISRQNSVSKLLRDASNQPGQSQSSCRPYVISVGGGGCRPSRRKSHQPQPSPSSSCTSIWMGGPSKSTPKQHVPPSSQSSLKISSSARYSQPPPPPSHSTKALASQSSSRDKKELKDKLAGHGSTRSSPLLGSYSSVECLSSCSLSSVSSKSSVRSSRSIGISAVGSRTPTPPAPESGMTNL